MLKGLKKCGKIGLRPRAYLSRTQTLKIHIKTCPCISVYSKCGKEKRKEKRLERFGFVWMDTVEMAPRLHFSVADFRFCSWQLLLTLFCFSSAMSPDPEDSGLLLLNTMLAFFLHNRAKMHLCWLYTCFGFSLVWNFSFGLFFVFDLWSSLVNAYSRVHLGFWF